MHCKSITGLAWEGKDSWFVILCSFSHTMFFGEGRINLHVSGDRSSEILSTTQLIMAELRFKPSSSGSKVCARHPVTATVVGRSHKGSGSENSSLHPSFVNSRANTLLSLKSSHFNILWQVVKIFILSIFIYKRDKIPVNHLYNVFLLEPREFLNLWWEISLTSLLERTLSVYTHPFTVTPKLLSEDQ